MRGFAAGSSRDPTLVSRFVLDDDTVVVVSEIDRLSTETESDCLPFRGTSGGVESIIVGNDPVKRSLFLGVEVSGKVPATNSLFGGGGLLGDKTSVSKEDAEI